MIRDIIQIDEEKCNGCGVCISACHEGALTLVDGKARLISETYCDGLGACLPECPTGAIRIVKKDAAQFTEPAPAHAEPSLVCGCPGSQSRILHHAKHDGAEKHHDTGHHHSEHHPERTEAAAACCTGESELSQWPVQIKLVPVQAPYLNNARLLIAADCAAYARANFHGEFIKGRITLIGCPKLDSVNYAEKLTEIFRLNPIKSIMVVRMEVPCCGGLEHAVRQALLASGKMIPWQVVTIGTDGRILEE